MIEDEMDGNGELAQSFTDRDDMNFAAVELESQVQSMIEAEMERLLSEILQEEGIDLDDLDDGEDSEDDEELMGDAQIRRKGWFKKLWKKLKDKLKKAAKKLGQKIKEIF